MRALSLLLYGWQVNAVFFTEHCVLPLRRKVQPESCVAHSGYFVVTYMCIHTKMCVCAVNEWQVLQLSSLPQRPVGLQCSASVPQNNIHERR